MRLGIKPVISSNKEFRGADTASSSKALRKAVIANSLINQQTKVLIHSSMGKSPPLCPVTQEAIRLSISVRLSNFLTKLLTIPDTIHPIIRIAIAPRILIKEEPKLSPKLSPIAEIGFFACAITRDGSGTMLLSMFAIFFSFKLI